MTSDIKKLIAIIEQQLDWGDSSAWQSRDFEILSQLIYDKTKVSLSESTLRRIWGRVEYKHLPSATTLDTLAQFAGFESWRTFIKQNTDKAPLIKTNILPVKQSEKLGINVTYLILTVVLIATGVVSFFIIKRSDPQINAADYKFSSQRLTNAIPNSVIFDYNAKNAPDDSVYVQQSWDPHTKTLVDKKMHQHTSVYYEPGFYQAKLLVGKKVVKQHKLIIPTEGWLGLIEDKPVPVYLNTQDFIEKDMLNLPVAVIKQKNMSMQPKPTYVKYYNVGNFRPVPLNDFNYCAEIKSGYKEGEAACQFAAVALITDSGPIIIPLSIKGCVSELTLFNVDRIISGKTANLSGFGVELSNWVKVSCKSTAKTIRYYVNDKQVFEFQLPANNVKIVGIWFGFQGTGAVRNIELKGQDKTVFKAF
ncbi:hypothetical protein [Mucilaginibacter xinganensis]|uniref:PKD domain-containing protein n=1 Tax=Mucilaginibacter xinganensis TaxID=1234841 RepID=A0A223NYJ5_9SPHI|nr:hypothetical protein [Mucilaginibacter xinganensis]ASU34668.1 hypothetical protein MuYL_2781 [Mucilaginibacter xinganensis]